MGNAAEGSDSSTPNPPLHSAVTSHFGHSSTCCSITGVDKEVTNSRCNRHARSKECSEKFFLEKKRGLVQIPAVIVIALLLVMFTPALETGNSPTATVAYADRHHDEDLDAQLA